MMSDEIGEQILSTATTAVSDGLLDGSGVIATSVVMLVSYIDPNGKPTDAYFHAGNPRFSQLLGVLETHTLRVGHWFTSGLEEGNEDDDE